VIKPSCFSEYQWKVYQTELRVCMKYAPLIDLLVLALNIYFAVVNRGTVWGWISTAIVLFYVWILLKAVRET